MAYPSYSRESDLRRIVDIGNIPFDITGEIESVRRALATPGEVRASERPAITAYLDDLLRRAGNTVKAAVGTPFEYGNPMGDIATTDDNEIGGSGFVQDTLDSFGKFLSSHLNRMAFIVVGVIVLIVALYSLANSPTLVVKK